MRLTPTRYGRVAPTLADWRRPVEVTFEFKTDIITSRQGYEQRAAMRENARVTIQQQSILVQEEAKRFLGDVAQKQEIPFVLPVDWRRVVLTAPAAPGATTVTVDAVPFWLVAGSHLVLFGAGTVESAVVQSVAGNVVTLTAALSGTYVSGDHAKGAYSARAQGEVSFRAETNNLWRGTITYEVEPGSDPQAVPTASPETFEGREVFLTAPNWRTRPRLSLKQRREIVDSGRGTIDVGSPTGRSEMELRLLYSGLVPGSAEDLIAFFLRQKGKRGEFWMPTWQQDIPNGTGSLGGSVLSITGQEAYFAYADSDVFNVLIAHYADGSHQINRVNDVLVNGLDTEFSMASPWAQAVDATTRLSWCPLWRFATDRLEVERITAGVAEMNFTVTTLRNEGV